MITHITSGYGVHVVGGFSAPYINMNQTSAGMMRSNGTSVEIYDGDAWTLVSSMPQIELTDDVVEVINWAKIKMREDRELKALADEVPAIKDLQEKLEFMIELCRDRRHA